jgi:hypothetical protein
LEIVLMLLRASRQYHTGCLRNSCDAAAAARTAGIAKHQISPDLKTQHQFAAQHAVHTSSVQNAPQQGVLFMTH